jgi:hypothetical protein
MRAFFMQVIMTARLLRSRNGPLPWDESRNARRGAVPAGDAFASDTKDRIE